MVRNILLGVGVFAALFAVLIFSGKIPIGNSKQTATGEVVIWGTIPETQMNPIIQSFNPKVRTYRVMYREVKEDAFNQTLLEALASGTGPDLILAPHQIILSQTARLYPFSYASFSEKAYKDMYVDGASIFLTPQGAIAFPVAIDPLVMFYNRTLFSKHGIISPPQYWDEVLNVTPSLTIRNQKGGFDESAIALGAPTTPYSKDVIMATVGELGQEPVLRQYRPDGAPYFIVTANTPAVTGGDVYPLSTVARFFTQFADPTKSSYTWNQFSGRADDQFVAEKLAIYIGYTSELATLRARNPKADIDMSYLPQTKGYNTFTTGGRLYGLATLKSSQNPVTAFTVQGQFAGSEISSLIAANLGTVPAFRTYASTPGLPEVVSRSMLVAKPWYDMFPVQSEGLVSTMLADIVSGRLGPSDAAASFVSRLQDLYTPN